MCDEAPEVTIKKLEVASALTSKAAPSRVSELFAVWSQAYETVSAAVAAGMPRQPQEDDKSR